MLDNMTGLEMGGFGPVKLGAWGCMEATGPGRPWRTGLTPSGWALLVGGQPCDTVGRLGKDGPSPAWLQAWGYGTGPEPEPYAGACGLKAHGGKP